MLNSQKRKAALKEGVCFYNGESLMIIGAIMSAISGGKKTASGMMGAMSDDIAIGLGLKDDEQGYHAEAYGTAYQRRTEARKAREKDAIENYYLYKEDDKPRQAARPVGPPPPPPIKTVDQFYAELSNKHLWGALPSLRMKRGDSTAPRYGNVDLQQREGGVARSLFNPYGE
jgi:hypothetical protein